MYKETEDQQLLDKYETRIRASNFAQTHKLFTVNLDDDENVNHQDLKSEEIDQKAHHNLSVNKNRKEPASKQSRLVRLLFYKRKTVLNTESL